MMAIVDGEANAEEPNFSDPEDFVDDIPEDEIVDDVIRQKPSEDDSADCVIIVDGIPKVSADRLPKLKSVLSKLFPKVGTLVSDSYPLDENGETKGYMFVEFPTKSQAEEAVAVFNGYKLDKNHSFTVNLLSDLDKYKNLDEKWEKAKPRPYKDHGNLRSWLLNPDCFDQFVIQWEGGERIAVCLNTPTEPTVIAEKNRWSDTTIRWSPFGTLLATVHQQGIALWGGENMEQIIKFSHPGVQFFDFSPNEKYVVTYAPPKHKYLDASDALRIFDVWTGELKRTFPGGHQHVKKWPHFKWSHDDKYLATMKDDSVYVFETPTFTLLEKKSIKIDNIRDFQWSPSDNVFAYWVAEKEHNPGRVAVMKIPDHIDIRSKNMFNLADASIFWQKSGENLAFKVERYGKKKEEKDEVKYSNVSYNVEIFHMKVKDLPVSTQEVKEPIQAFGWEPSGMKFCVIHGDLRSSASFYLAKSNPATIVHIKTLEQKNQVNTIYWAPQGGSVVLAGLKTVSSGPLVFVDASSDKDVTVFNNQEHPAVTDVEWDPTGRFVVSYVSSWSASSRGVDFGYSIWNFQGRLLQRRPTERFCAFSWRPRPPPVITEAKIKEVKKDMKKYSAAFEERDKLVSSKASKEIVEKRRSQMDDFTKWRSERRQEWLSERKERMMLRGGADTDDIHAAGAIEEEVVEYMISQEETTEP